MRTKSAHTNAGKQSRAHCLHAGTCAPANLELVQGWAAHALPVLPCMAVSRRGSLDRANASAHEEYRTLTWDVVRWFRQNDACVKWHRAEEHGGRLPCMQAYVACACTDGFCPGTFHWQVAPTEKQSNTRNCHQHISQMPHGLCHASHPHLRPRHCALYTANAPRRYVMIPAILLQNVINCKFQNHIRWHISARKKQKIQSLNVFLSTAHPRSMGDAKGKSRSKS